MSTRSGGSSQSSGMDANAAGGRVRWVMSNSVMRSTRSGPTRRSSSTSTIVQPLNRLMHWSHTDMSNMKDANRSTWQCGPSPNVSRTVDARLLTPVCGTATPFGRPVEPDV